MKNLPLFAAAALLLGVSTFSSCIKDKCSRTVTYISVEPVYVTLEEVRNSTAVREEPRELKEPGQIYYYNNTMYVVEKREGVHVIDNTDPRNPVNTAFIKIAGNQDIAIKDGLMYANSYVDMLVIDLQDYQVVGRAEGIIQPFWEDLANDRILVEYVEKEVTEVMSCEEQDALIERGGVFFGGPMLANAEAVFDANLSSAGGTGIAGSLAHFSIIGDYLYTIQHDGYSMDIFDLTQPTEPAHANTVRVGFHLETLFPYGDKLFVGSNVGMFIYDNSDPVNPVELSMFEHARACDPVFVYGDYAYVTLWDGSSCGAGPNQLDVIDISDLAKPVLKSSFTLQNPHGLSVKDNVLLLCEGDFGFKSFDNSDPLTVGDHLLGHAKNVHATDVISLPGNADVAMVIGEGGFYQYGFDDPENMELLSVIEVKR
ncbi:MAG TPA: hypothetical protein ENJ95_00075 [Bacteroidetes bacterium]|nr:hypothetical protein [Bacteroidota bacterium]